MPAELEAPPAPAAPVTPAAPTITPPIAPSIEPVGKRGPAFSKMREGLTKIAKPLDPTKPSIAQPPQSTTPEAKAPVKETPESHDPQLEDESHDNDPNERPATDTKVDPANQPTSKEAKPKANPWKVVDQWKTRAAELEKQLAEAKSSSPYETEKKGYLERIENYEKKVAELESEMYFVNYEKSSDFQAKYNQPYEKAWAAAMEEFKELTIEDSNTGQHRAVSPDDLFTLVNLPIREARELANSLYGEFADDIMAHRKEIKKLYHQRTEALKEAREKGIVRDRERSELEQKNTKELHESISNHWAKANEEVTKHEVYGPFLVPVEGDQEGNQRLAKGFELVDRAMRENPLDPKLSADERSRIVRRQAAVRNRAAAFGRMKLWIDNLRSENATLKKDLSQFRSSEPNTQGSTSTPPQTPASARDRIFSALRKAGQ